MKKSLGVLLMMVAGGAQAAMTDLICSMDEIDSKTDEVTHTDGVKVSVPDQSSRSVRSLTYYNSDRIVEEWEITPTHSNYRYRKIIDGDIVKIERSSIEASSGKVLGSMHYDPSPYLRIRGHKEKESTFSGQCYLAPVEAVSTEVESKTPQKQ